MHAEIKFFCHTLNPDSCIEQEMPIAHLIHRTPFAMTVGKSSFEGTVGFTIGLGFWWHVWFLDEIVQCTLLLQDVPFDYVTVIINYIDALHILQTTNVTDDPHLALLNITDNSSAARDQELDSCLATSSALC
jgi:hypothetical protein